MTMITITDDDRHTFMIDPAKYYFKHGTVRDENGRIRENCIVFVNADIAEGLFFDTQESMQAVWDRLCKLLNATDIMADPDGVDDSEGYELCFNCGKVIKGDREQLCDDAGAVHIYCLECAGEF